jgi:hypothetical protein
LVSPVDGAGQPRKRKKPPLALAGGGSLSPKDLAGLDQLLAASSCAHDDDDAETSADEAESSEEAKKRMNRG